MFNKQFFTLIGFVFILIGSDLFDEPKPENEPEFLLHKTDEETGKVTRERVRVKAKKN